MLKCFTLQVYSNVEGNRSHVVNTGWAMLALIDAGQVFIKYYFITFSISIVILTAILESFSPFDFFFTFDQRHICSE
jgi:hypothetical protein